MKYCPNCGSKVKPGAKFCDNCGCQLDTKSKQAGIVAKSHTTLTKVRETKWGQRLKKRPKITAISALVAVILIICGVFWYQNAHNVAKVIPGHVYKVKDSYLAFGKGDNDSKVVIASDKNTAVNAEKSPASFKAAYKSMTAGGVQSATYSATKDSFKVNAKVLEKDTSSEHSTDNGGDEFVVGSTGSILANDLLGPLAKAAGNMLGDALNSASETEQPVEVDYISADTVKVKGKNLQVSGKIIGKAQNNLILTRVN